MISYFLKVFQQSLNIKKALNLLPAKNLKTPLNISSSVVIISKSSNETFSEMAEGSSVESIVLELSEY